MPLPAFRRARRARATPWSRGSRLLGVALVLVAVGCSAGTTRRHAWSDRKAPQKSPPASTSVRPGRAPGVPTAPATDDNGRTELAVYQAIQGAMVGSGVGVLMASSGVSGAFAGFLLPTVLYPVVMLKVVDDDFPTTRVQVMESTTFWWFYQSMFLGEASQRNRGFGTPSLLGRLGAFGLATGLFASHWVGYALSSADWESGQVAMMNSVGFWAGIITLAQLNSRPRRMRGGATCTVGCPTNIVLSLVATNAGLVAGAMLGAELQVSRAQVLWIDGLAGIGAIVGMASGNDDETANRGIAIGATIGAVVGAAAMMASASGPLLRPVEDYGLRVMPTVGAEGQVGLTLGGSW